jgi:hypothetical protein
MGMQRTEALVIDEYVHRLGRSLRGPGRLREDLLTEARHSLIDTAEGYRGGGLPDGEAERRAVAEFGSVAELAAGYQAELAAGTARRLALRIILVDILLFSTADLMWLGAPRDGAKPSAGYILLSTSLNRLWVGFGLLALLTYAWLTWGARHGQPGSVRAVRAVGHVLTASFGVSALAAIALYLWSFELWTAALTWPPMLIGGVALAVVYTWLGRAAGSALASARAPRTP